MGNLDSLNVQIGPIVGHADGPLAIIALVLVVAVYVLGPLAATEVLRRLNRRLE